MKHKYYIVVGTSPSLSKEVFEAVYNNVLPRDVCLIAANGAGVILDEWGYKVDILCTTTHFFRPHLDRSLSNYELKTRNKLSRLLFPKIYVDVKNYSYAVAEIFQMSLGPIICVNEGYREQVMLRIGVRPLRVSTGVWALCLAVYKLAQQVTVLGIDPSSTGHWSNHGEGFRDHVEEDKEVLEQLSRYSSSISIIY